MVRRFGMLLGAMLLCFCASSASATTAVTIASPASGATVSGTVSIVANVSSSVSWVNVYIDGHYFQSSPPYNFSWNSTSVQNGSHVIGANAYSSTGALLGSASVTVNVANGVTATATPVATATPTTTSAVTITSPANGSTVAGTVSVVASVSSSVTWVNVYIDGHYWISSPPYTFSWNSTSVANGTHTISANAYSSTSTLLGTSSVTVSVANGVSTATPAPTATPILSTSTPTPVPTTTVAPTATATVAPTATATATATAAPTATPTSTTSSSAVTITSPGRGSTVAGTVSVVAQASSAVTWVNVYIDGAYWISSPPYTFSWNSTSVANGSHTISANAYSSTSSLLGTSSVSVTVCNGCSISTATPAPSSSATPAPTATPTVIATATPAPTPTPAPTSTTPGANPTPGPGGTAYYVDPAGSDSNAGTSPTSAWRTVSRVDSASLKAGDVVYFKRGGIWREQLIPGVNGVSGNPISFSAYGSGAQPIISGADLVSGWSNVSGNVYQASYSGNVLDVYVDGGTGPAAQNFAGSDSMWGLLKANCAYPGTCSASGSTYIGTMQAGSWYSNGSTLYVWLGDGSNPANHTVEAATRSTCIGGGTTRSYLTFNDLAVQRCGEFAFFYSSNSNPAAGSLNLTFDHLTGLQAGTGQLDFNYYNGLHISRGENIRYTNNHLSYCGDHGNCINNQDADNSVAKNNVISHWNHHCVDSKSSDNFLVYGNTCTDALLGPSGSAFSGSGVNNSNGFNGIYQECATNNGRTGSGSAGQYLATGWTLEFNVVANIQGHNAGVGIQDDSSASCGGGNKIYNNTVYNVTQSGLSLGTSGNLYNNIIANAAGGAIGGGSGYSKDYNDCANGGCSGAHDLNTNPMFVNPSAENFQLQSGSPCIQSGTSATGLPYSGSAPDRGVF